MLFDDLVFVHRYLDSVGVLLSDGEARFVPTPLFHSGRKPHQVTYADFDEDGAVDLASSNTVGESVSLLFNRVRERAGERGGRRQRVLPGCEDQRGSRGPEAVSGSAVDRSPDHIGKGRNGDSRHVRPRVKTPLTGDCSRPLSNRDRIPPQMTTAIGTWPD